MNHQPKSPIQYAGHHPLVSSKDPLEQWKRPVTGAVIRRFSAGGRIRVLRGAGAVDEAQPVWMKSSAGQQDTGEMLRLALFLERRADFHEQRAQVGDYSQMRAVWAQRLRSRAATLRARLGEGVAGTGSREKRDR